MEQSSTTSQESSTTSQESSRVVMEPEISCLYSQDLVVTCRYPEPDQVHTLPNDVLTIRFNIILPSTP
jgi:hypothetical protein